MEIKKLKLESLKALIDGLKVKILLFSGAFGGSFAMLSKSSELFTGIFFIIATITFFVAIMVNLFKLNKYLKEIERLKSEW